jgi:hypothetical protein
MSQFDIDAYFANAAANSPNAQKRKTIDEALQAKLAGLKDVSTRKQIEIAGPLASFGAGAGGLVEGVGTLVGLATGDMENSLRELGKSRREFYEARKPVTLVANEAERRAAIDQETTQSGKFAKAITETLTNPTLAVNLAAEQVPNLIPGGLAGRAVGATGKALKVGEELLPKVVTAAAVSTGAAQQGADVAGGTYDDLIGLPQETWDKSPEYQQLEKLVGADEAKHTIALAQSRKAGAASGVASLASQYLPGGHILEDALAANSKLSLGVISGLVAGALGEATQEAIEEGSGVIASNISKQAVDPTQDTYEGVGEAAGLGAVGGGLLGGPIGGLSGAANTARNIMQEGAVVQERNQKRAEVLDTAKETGDVSGLMDPEQADVYDPVAAATVLAEKATNKDATEEERTTYQTKLEDVIAQQETRIADLQSTPEEQADNAETLKQLKELLPTVEKDDPRYEDMVALITDLETAGPRTEKEITKATEQLSVMKSLAAVQDKQKAAEITPAVKADLIKQVQDDAAPEGEAAAGKLVSLMMESPEMFDGDLGEIDKLAQNKRFTSEQQQYLRAFSEARVQQNLMKTTNDVSLNILNGDKATGFKGLIDYTRNVNKALQARDTKKARAEITQLVAFQKDHRQKAEVVKSAYETAKKDGGNHYVLRTDNGWHHQPTLPEGMDKDGLRENGGLDIHRGSGSIVNAIKVESKGIYAAGQVLRASLKVWRTVAPEATTEPVIPSPAKETPTPTKQDTTGPKSDGASDSPRGESGSPSPETNTGSETVKRRQERDAIPIAKRSIEQLKSTIADLELQEGAIGLNADQVPVLAEAKKELTKRTKPAGETKTTSAKAQPKAEVGKEPAVVITEKELDTVDFRVSTAENPLVREARDSVRKALLAMNFKFVDIPVLPDVTDIERIASKILSGTSNDDPAFIKDAAQALSYALFHELGATERSTASREWIESALTEWLTTGKPPTDATKKTVWLRVMELYNQLMSFFSSKEYETIQKRLTTAITDIRTGSKDFSFQPQKGFEKLVFQKEMDNNPEAVKVLLALTKAGLKFTLTGSVAYSDQVPVYRQSGKPLHDIDLLMSEDAIVKSQELLSQGDFGQGTVLYSFKPKGRVVVGMAVVPKGYEIRNMKSGWRPKTNAVYRSYEVYDSNTGEQVGSYSYEAHKHETFQGMAGVTVDLMSAGELDTVSQSFQANGEQHTLAVASYIHGFTKKLEMLRYKDIRDFVAVIPPTPIAKPTTEETVEQPPVEDATPVGLDEQEQVPLDAYDDIEQDYDPDAPPPDQEDAAPGESPAEPQGDATRVGGFDIEVVGQDDGVATAWSFTDADGFFLEVQLYEDQDGNDLYVNVDNEEETWDSWNDVIAHLESLSAVDKTADGELTLPPLVDAEGKPIERISGMIPAALFKSLNLVSNYFRQRKATAKSAPNALLQHKDLMSTLFDSNGKLNQPLLETLIKTQTITTEQVNQLENFAGFAATGKQLVIDALTGPAVTSKGAAKKQDPDFWHRNYMEFFRRFDEKGQELPLEDNLVTGILLGAYSWTVENGGSSPFNFDDTIRAMLGLGKEDYLAPEKRNALRYAGTRQTLVEQALGNKVFSALGFEAVKNTPENEVIRLKLALGSTALAVLQQYGLVEHHKIPASVFSTTEVAEAYSEDNGPVDQSYDDQSFIKVIYKVYNDTNEEITNPPLENILSAAKNTKGILARVFAVEDEKRPPQLKPSTTEQKSIRKTSQGVPTRAKKIAKKVNAEAYFIRDDMRTIRNALDTETLQKIAGWKDLSKRVMHRLLKTAHEATNDEILRDIAGFAEFEEGVTDESFFFTNQMWRPQRNGFAERLVNPQTSKYQRHIIGKRGWETTFDPNDSTDPLHVNFRLAIAQGLGIKVDKQVQEQSLRELEAFLDDDIVAVAIDVLRDIKPDEKLSAEDQAFVLAAVQAGEMKTHSLDALVNYANFLNAQRDGKPFTTHIMFEVDGVSNGVALTHTQLGLNNNLMGPGFGMVSEGQNLTGFGDFRGRAGARDIYEQLATSIQNLLASGAATTSDLAPVFYFMGDLVDKKTGDIGTDARNLVKYPLLMLMFGGSIPNNVKNMANAFVDEFMSKLEEGANLEGSEEQKLAAIQETVTQFNLMARYNPIAEPATVEEAMQLAPSGIQRAEVAEYFTETFGAAVKGAMETQFADLVDLRGTLNKGAQAAFAFYNAARNALIKKRMDALMDSGDLDFRMVSDPLFDDKGKKIMKNGKQARGKSYPQPLQTLSKEEIAAIEKELEPIKPVIHTWLSQQYGSRSTGIDVSGVTDSLVDKENRAFTQQVELRTFIPDNALNPKSDGSFFKQAKGMRRLLGDPGVRAVVLAIHSVDSAISMLTTEMKAALNMHDANGFGVKDMAEGAHAMNENTLKVLSEYSVPLAIYDMLQQSYHGQAALVKAHPELKDVFQEATMGFPGKARVVDSTLLGELAIAAHEAEIKKLDFLLGLKIMDQYTFEGGEYHLTADDKAALEKRKAEVVEAKKKIPKVAEKIRPEFDQLPEYVPGQQTMTYAGIGSRETPREILQAMQHASKILAERGYTLLSGAAKGADLAFESGAGSNKQIFRAKDATEQTMQIAREIHPAPKALKDYILQLMGRNTFQIFGANLDSPVDFVLTWTPDGAETAAARTRATGGTGQAIEMASRKGVPIINMANPGWEERLQSLIDAKPPKAKTETPVKPKKTTKAKKAKTTEAKPEPKTTTPVMQTSVWGELGTPAYVPSDLMLEVLTDPTQNATIHEVVAALQDTLWQFISDANKAKRHRNDSGTFTDTNGLHVDVAKSYAQLLQKLTKSGRLEGLSIRYITPDTPLTVDDELDFKTINGQSTNSFKTAAGWYNPRTKTISIKGVAFKSSRIQSATILHEMVHAVLQDTVDQFDGLPMPAGSKDQVAWEAVQELKQLHEATKQLLKTDPSLKAKYPNAFDNVHELVAWGMTNPGFQRDVLLQLPMNDVAGKPLFKSVGSSRIKSGFQAFMVIIHKALFGAKRDLQSETGLGVLVGNVNTIFKSLTDTQGAPQDQPQASLFMQTSTVDFTPGQVFEALGNLVSPHSVAPNFRTHLRAILASVVETAYGNNPVLRNAALRTAPATPEDVYLQALANQDTPFASKLSTLLPMDHQSGFVAEAAEVTLRAALKNSPTTQHEVRRIWQQAKAKVPHSVFGTGNAASDKAQWDLIFTPEQNADKSSDYLSQFMAAALTYAPLYAALQGIETGVVEGSLREGSLIKRINLLFAKLLNMLSHRATGAKTGQAGGEALSALAHHLAVIEQKRMTSLDLEGDRAQNVVDKLSAAVKGTNDKVRAKIAEKADALQEKHSNTIIQGFAGIVGTLAGDRVEQFWDLVYRIRDDVDNERYGWLASTINEARGVRDVNEIAHLLLDQANTHEQLRKKTMIRTTKFAEGLFDTKLEKEQSVAFTRVVLRTGLHTLLRDFRLKDITKMLSDQQKVDHEIRNYERQLKTIKGIKFYDYYLTSAKALGHQMATGKVTVTNLVTNTHNITYMAGTRDIGKVDDTVGEQVEHILDPLISLYALKYSSLEHRRAVAKVAGLESQRADKGNGFLATMLWQKKAEEDAQTNLFAQDKYHMVKGYTKDIFNPHLDLITAEARDEAMLEQAGYVEVTTQPLKNDAADTGPLKKLFVMNGRGLNSMQLGFLSNTGKRFMGSAAHGDLIDSDTGQPNPKSKVINKRIAYNKQRDLKAMYRNGEAFDPTKVRENYLVPVFNGKGEAVNYRYLMAEETKDSVLKRDNRLEHVMGHMAGSALDKAATPANNQRGIDALFAQYEDSYLEEPQAFVEVSDTSTDPEVRERYRLLPKETRDYAKQVWGSNKIMVRKDTYDLAFGYRKYSLYNAFTKPEELRTHLDRFMVWMLGEVVIRDEQGNITHKLGSQRALQLLKMENAWQEIVKEVKDLIVIKNFWTLWGNEMSNFTLLALSGVPLKKIIKNKIVAYQATVAYQKADEELAQIQIQLDTGYVLGGNRTALEQRVVELQDELQQNPVRVLVDAGMFQTLVEDVGAEEDPYSYKSRFTETVDKYTGAASDREIVQGARKVGKFLLMTHDTGLYKFLNKATILSDFTSRYVLYEHLTTRKKNTLDSHTALMQARASFVNYDVPTHKATQYLNDMGLVWFTKYYLRIQAVIFNTVRENPLGALSLLGLDELTGGFSDILDSSMVSRWPLNLGWGAFEYPSSLNELATFQALEAML